jgi:hypothetical protein
MNHIECQREPMIKYFDIPLREEVVANSRWFWRSTGYNSVLGFTFVHWVRLPVFTKVTYDFIRSVQLADVSSTCNERRSDPHAARNLQHINLRKNITRLLLYSNYDLHLLNSSATAIVSKCGSHKRPENSFTVHNLTQQERLFIDFLV